MAKEEDIDPFVSMQQELCDMWRINNQKKYVFYYDESNNCRKFWIDDSKQQFNSDYKADGNKCIKYTYAQRRICAGIPKAAVGCAEEDLKAG